MIENTTYLNHKAANVYRPLRTRYDFCKETIAVYHMDTKLTFVQMATTEGSASGKIDELHHEVVPF